jgi:hypothetical protein
MIKKKAAKKTAMKKGARKSAKKFKKETDPAEVRKQVSMIVKAEAALMTQAVVDEAKKGQLAPVRYLFDMANIFPGQTDPQKAPEESADCLAEILLSKIEAPAKPEKEGEDELEDPESETDDAEKKPAVAGAASDSGNGERKEPIAMPVGTAVPIT